MPPERFVVGWLGRMTEIKRVDDLLRAFARLRAPASTPTCSSSATGRCAPSSRRWPPSSASRDRCHFAGFRDDVGAIYAAMRRGRAHLGERGDAGDRDRGAGRRASRSSRPTSAASRRRRRRADRASSSPPGDVERSPTRSRGSPTTATLRARLGEAGRETRRSTGTPCRGSWTTSTGSTASCSSAERAARAAQAAGRAAGARRSRRVTTSADRRAGSRRARLAVLPARGRGDAVADAGVRRVPAGARARRDRDLRVPEPSARRHSRRVPRPLVEDDRSNPYRVLRVWVKASEEKTQRTRLAFYLSYMALATAVAPLAGRADVVVATTPPLFTGVAGLAIARLNARAARARRARPLAGGGVEPGADLRRDGRRAAEVLERRLYRAAPRGRRRDAPVLRAHRRDPRRRRRAAC